MTQATSRTQQLFEAIRAGDSAAVRTLLESDPALAHATNAEGIAPLMDATYRGREEVAELLIARGATIDIFAAAALGRTERLEALLHADPALVDAVSTDGFTPLALASFFGRRDAAALLLAHGANVHAVAQNPLGNMPIHSASAASHADLVALLLDHAADANARDIRGWTPLSLAAANGRPDIVTLLLARGADPNAANDEGTTALALAREKGHQDVAALLEQAGAGA